MIARGPNEIIDLGNGTTGLIIDSPKYGKKICLIDTEDYIKVKKYRWCLVKINNTFYVYKTNPSDILLHRLITDAKEIDHIDHNGLNNKKENLRCCSRVTNGRNSQKRSGTSSKYKGVSWNKNCQKWRAYINTTHMIHLGLFLKEDEAANAYNKAAKKYFGEFANLNIIEGK